MNKILQRKITAISVNFLADMNVHCFLSHTLPGNISKPQQKKIKNRTTAQATGQLTLPMFGNQNLFVNRA